LVQQAVNAGVNGSDMRKDYFAKILEIHTSTRTGNTSSFCELHALTSDDDNHNSIFCNLADWDDSFTSLLEIFAFREIFCQIATMRHTKNF